MLRQIDNTEHAKCRAPKKLRRSRAENPVKIPATTTSELWSMASPEMRTDMLNMMMLFRKQGQENHMVKQQMIKIFNERRGAPSNGKSRISRKLFQ